MLEILKWYKTVHIKYACPCMTLQKFNLKRHIYADFRIFIILYLMHIYLEKEDLGADFSVTMWHLQWDILARERVRKEKIREGVDQPWIFKLGRISRMIVLFLCIMFRYDLDDDVMLYKRNQYIRFIF